MLVQELSTSRRPAKDKATFYALLPPAVEFVQGSSTGTLVVGHTKLKPINASPESQTEPNTTKARRGSAHENAVASSSASSPDALDTSWAFLQEVGAGLNNTGNTCFLNSALQCLIHTAPLANVIKGHECRVRKGFCMSCGLKAVVMDSLMNKKRSLTPYMITNGLKSIAKHMVRGRQEDSHEFLRFAVDALQKSCLVGYGPKPDPKIAESTWVHKIFGGRLRSRVTCSQCKHNSDTFDNILDLSLEITGTRNLNEALKKFTKVDHLTGQNKYKCEKCKKLVSAQKRFTVDQAPNVLTIHLKRFSPLGRKIGQQVDYDQHISLDDVMSEAPPAPLAYTLYGVICHAGGGPNSGHYYAFVKGGRGAWYEMNDESVTRCRPATSLKSAYILFYIRDSTARSNGVRERPVTPVSTTPKQTPLNAPQKGVVAAMGKKRKTPDSASATPEPATKRPFIGPQLSTKDDTPVTSSKFKKVGEHAPSSSSASMAETTAALGSLSAYGDDEDDDDGDKAATPESAPSTLKTPVAPAPAHRPLTPGPIAPSNFYGAASSTSAGTKRKAEEDLREKSGLPKNFTGRQVTYGRRAKKQINFKKLQNGVTAM
ncbi:unnamed protein product [Peniophora sp. CBMAI 1063]|nr:unnamed protein product [Peniophora sp. CBMAI 1063]